MRCDYAGCEDSHIGKFDSCLDEVLYEWGLHGWGETTGDVEFEGHLTLLTFEEDTPSEDDDFPDLIIPAGSYIVTCTNGGFVDVTRYDTEEEARKVFAEAEERYGEWTDQEED